MTGLAVAMLQTQLDGLAWNCLFASYVVSQCLKDSVPSRNVSTFNDQPPFLREHHYRLGKNFVSLRRGSFLIWLQRTRKIEQYFLTFFSANGELVQMRRICSCRNFLRCAEVKDSKSLADMTQLNRFAVCCWSKPWYTKVGHNKICWKALGAGNRWSSTLAGMDVKWMIIDFSRSI